MKKFITSCTGLVFLLGYVLIFGNACRGRLEPTQVYRARDLGAITAGKTTPPLTQPDQAKK